MTTIAYRNGIMAADSLVVVNGTITGYVDKIRRREDGYLAGACGDLTWAREFLDWFELNSGGEPPVGGEYDKAIVAKNGEMITVYESEGHFQMPSEFYVIGSGQDAALGALHAGASAKQAVEASIKVDVYSGGPIKVLTCE